MEEEIKSAQRIIADNGFKYLGNSVLIIDVVNAIKRGYRLFNESKFDNEISRLKDFIMDWRADSTPEEVYRLVEAIEEIVKGCE